MAMVVMVMMVTVTVTVTVTVMVTTLVLGKTLVDVWVHSWVTWKHSFRFCGKIYNEDFMIR